MYSKLCVCVSAILVLFVLHVQSTHMMGGGQGPIIIRSSDRKGRNNDMFMIGAQTKCGQGPILMRSGRRRGKLNDMIMIGGAQCKEVKKTETKIVPYPVKEQVHIPVPYKETVHVPVHIPVHVPVPMKEDYGMSMGGYGGGGGGGGGGYRRRRSIIFDY